MTNKFNYWVLETYLLYMLPYFFNLVLLDRIQQDKVSCIPKPVVTGMSQMAGRVAVQG